MGNLKAKKILTAILIILVLVGLALLRFKNKIYKVALPPAITYNAVSTSGNGNANPQASDPTLPTEVNLAIPFTSQAPHQNWAVPYQQFCEEASTLMAASYVKSENISGLNDADAKLLSHHGF